MTASILIVGAGRVGSGLATKLQNRDERVVLLEIEQERAESLLTEGYTVHHGDGTDIEDLRTAGIETARTLVVATGDDDTNLLVSQLANATFDVDVIARVNTPSNVAPFEELDIRVIGSNRAVALALDNEIERPSLSSWTSDLEKGGAVQEIELTVEKFVGQSISQLDAQLPEGVLIGLINRKEQSQMPDPGFVLEHGDHLTLLGRSDAVDEAYEMIHPA